MPPIGCRQPPPLTSDSSQPYPSSPPFNPPPLPLISPSPSFIPPIPPPLPSPPPHLSPSPPTPPSSPA